MADQNPYAQWSNPYAGFRPVGNPDPKKPLEIRRAQQDVTSGDLKITKDAATQAADIRRAQAEADSAEIKARTDRITADAATGEIPGDRSKTGAAYLATLPQGMADRIVAMYQGRVGTPLNPRNPSDRLLSEAATHAFPDFDATKFNARLAAIKNVATGQLGKSSNAIDTAIGHAGMLYDQASGVAGHNGLPWMPFTGPIVNHIENAWNSGSPGLNLYRDTLSKLGPEEAKAYGAGTAGERGDMGAILSENLPLDTKRATIRNALELFASKEAANAHQFDWGNMGNAKPSLDLLDPHARATLQRIAPDILEKYFTPSHDPMLAASITGQMGGAPPMGGATPSGNPGGGGSPLNPASGAPATALSAGAAYSTPQDQAVAAAISHAYYRGGGIPEMVDAAKAAGYNPTLEDIAGWQQGVDTARKSGRELQVVPQQSGHRNPVSQALGAAAMTPLGTAVTGATNMAGFGALQAIAPDQYQGLSALNPDSMLAGEIGGTFAGTGGLAKAAGAGTGKFLPSSMSQFLLKDSKLANAARSLATDTAYGAGYGEVTNGDPVGGAVAAGIGHGLGVGAGKAVGKVIGGIDLAAPQAYLRSRGIPLTVGQLLGGPAKGIEDAMTSIPFAGDKVIARRMEGLRAFNSAALNDAGAPIGATVPSLGNEGVQSLRNQATAAYDRATAGVNVPLDPQFHTDMQGVAQQASQLPPDLATRFDLAEQNRIGPILDQGALTGDSYQQAQRGLGGYKAEMTKPGFEQDYRGALSAAQQVLKDQMLRGGGQDVVSGLGAADQAWRGMKTIDRATQAAKNGTQSGDLQTFTPAQLNTADWQAVNRYGGQRQFGDLIDAGQQVLPSKLPDSGTAKRLATQMLGGSLLTGGSTAAGYASGDTEDGAFGGLGMLGLLTLGGTKAGQHVLSGMLLNRPEIAQAVGRAISQRSGMFGTSAVPLMLQPSN